MLSEFATVHEPVVTEFPLGGILYWFRFDNGYGASVIQHPGSYGGRNGEWELAVLRFEDDGSWKLVYDTPIACDVLPFLETSEIPELLDRIAAL